MKMHPYLRGSVAAPAGVGQVPFAEVARALRLKRGWQQLSYVIDYEQQWQKLAGYLRGRNAGEGPVQAFGDGPDAEEIAKARRRGRGGIRGDTAAGKREGKSDGSKRPKTVNRTKAS
ncbi:MAG TPA: hypothetical protein VJQ54_00405 [Candidatus Sulfotelmatobacter sp.]|nr:hypothetical protein [Candidatus Sulfotelmatobacter sp.]